MNKIDVGRLRARIAYDHESGRLTWRNRPLEDFKNNRAHSVWNARFAGKPALNADKGNGYKMGRFEWKAVLAHRAAWAIHYGWWPEIIDHINGDPSDNRIANLRSVDLTVNAENKGLGRRNTSGKTGVGWSKSRRRWVAYIGKGKKSYRLGRFKNLSEAVEARVKAEELLNFSGRT